ncbi:hypothetical protein Q4511_10865 [Paracoccus sp. 1_MG-2023]|uniref:hypothetical protein n=1 Tax=unclassified Paracoccus (in: a-proteobacteria) TaxID=2688777 RepID=UPI001C088762|nr:MULTISPECIES: hypothetical protein [unclassified Paracoccus (in: a-proteobacteria)]MBU2959140.1 hypothetical protein [Paracoccus sp. C2R09]MDO6669424.1 hypothetical protein [Paracoccus sp. 1_MG-2023]
MTADAKKNYSMYVEIVNEMYRIVTASNNCASPMASYQELFGQSLPRLIGTSSGGSLQVTERIDNLIEKVSSILYENSGHTETHSEEEYWKVVRAAFGDPLMQLDLTKNKEALASDLKEAVIARVLSHFKARVRVYAFSCSMFEEGKFEPFSIGPVSFSSRQSWITLSEQNKLIDVKTANRARQRLKGEELDVLGGVNAFYERDLFELVLGPSRNVCSVTTQSLGLGTSEKRAAETANLAITVLSLFEPSASVFHRSSFLAYDTSPYLKKVMSFARDQKILAGSSRSHYPPSSLDSEEFSKFLQRQQPELNVAGEALSYGVMSDDRASRPRISHAIRTSLIWFRRGCIDNDDRAAIVFFSAALDALSPRGKLRGITDLVCQTLGKKPTDALWLDGPEIHKLLKDIYDQGRSRLIHGTSDRTNRDWSQLRKEAELVAKWCLLGALIFYAKRPECDELEALSLPAT